MTDEQINIAIAEACGKRRRVMSNEKWKIAYNEWCNETDDPHAELTCPSTHEGTVSNYCHDLNAMHEVEKTLARDNVWAYRRALENQLGIAGGMASGSIDEHMFHATARQRSEAFLRVKGLWKEEV